MFTLLQVVNVQVIYLCSYIDIYMCNIYVIYIHLSNRYIVYILRNCFHYCYIRHASMKTSDEYSDIQALTSARSHEKRIIINIGSIIREACRQVI